MAKISDYDHNDSFDDVDDLLGMIMPERGRPLDTFIGFLDARLANQNWTTSDLAQRIDQTPAWVSSLLQGQISTDQITDELVVRIARAIEYQPNVLRIMLNREIVPTVEQPQPEEPPRPFEVDESLEGYRIEIDRLMEEITEYLLDRVEERYDGATRRDARKSKQHDFVIKQIEMIVAKHRTDIRTVEILIDELKATVESDDPVFAGLHRLDIRRIIHTIRTR